MTTIKIEVDKEIEECFKCINVFFDNIINEIYEKLKNIEEQINDDKNAINSRVTLDDLDFLKKNSGIFLKKSGIFLIQRGILLKHINYFDLNCNSIKLNNFDTCYSYGNLPSINIDKIFKDIPKNNKDAKIIPFVLLEIPKNFTFKNYKNIINETEKAFANITPNFLQTEKYKLKIIKFKNEHFFYIILFFDCLNYNNEFVFKDYSIENIINTKDIFVTDYVTKKQKRYYFW